MMIIQTLMNYDFKKWHHRLYWILKKNFKSNLIEGSSTDGKEMMIN